MVLIKGTENIGFAAGNNLGIKLAQEQSDFEAVVLLNNDTIVHPYFLYEILKYKSQNISANLIGGRIFLYEPNDVLWYDGGKLCTLITRATHTNQNRNILEIPANSKPHKTQFITGCLFYISKKCLEQIGLLEESLFMYCEDIEYCLRAKKKGFTLYYVPNSVIWHKVGKSSGGKISGFSTYWGTRNRIKVARLHLNFYSVLLTISFLVLSRIPRFIEWYSKGRIDIIKAQIKGIKDGLKNEI
jgi:hypothetical protein